RAAVEARLSRDGGAARSLRQMVEVLRVAGLCKNFGVIRVADELDFELARGECLGVIGPNGAGKSSVLNLIVGLIRPDAGSIPLDGHDTTGLPPHRRARLGIGRAFQIPQPFPHLTVFENVLVAASFGGSLHGAVATDWAMQVLRTTSLDGKADR